MYLSLCCRVIYESRSSDECLPSVSITDFRRIADDVAAQSHICVLRGLSDLGKEWKLNNLIPLASLLQSVFTRSSITKVRNRSTIPALLFHQNEPNQSATGINYSISIPNRSGHGGRAAGYSQIRQTPQWVGNRLPKYGGIEEIWQN